jgi:hypothetical protein
MAWIAASPGAAPVPAGPAAAGAARGGGCRRAPRRRLRLRQLELHARLAHVAQARARVLGEGAPQELGDARRQRGQRRPVGLAGEHRGHDVAEGLAGEGAPAREALVEHAAEGPHVRAPVHRPAAGLFGAHVRGRAGHDTLLGHQEDVGLRRGRAVLAGAGKERLREAEVEELHGALGRDAHVGRLQVAVHDARLVRGLESLGDLPADVDRLVHAQRPARQARREVLAGHEFHRQEAGVAHLVDAVDARHVRVVERGQRPRLALEPAVARAPDLSHAPRSDGLDDLVVRERLARRE